MFHDFLAQPPYRRQFFTTIHQQIWQIFAPPPLRNADVLNGWSLCAKSRTSEYMDVAPGFGITTGGG